MRIISGSLRSLKLQTLSSTTTRPSSDRLKESLFNAMFMRCDGQTWCDLFAGSGAIGLEALSRGANKVVFIEKDADAFRILKANIEKCHMQSRSICLHDDAHKVMLKHDNFVFDVIFIDPPYELPLEPLVFDLHTHSWVNSQSLLVFERKASESLEWLHNYFDIIKQRKVGQSQYVIARIKV